MNEMKTSIAPNSSEGRAQRRNPSLSNSKEESREIGMVVIREPGRREARAEKPECVFNSFLKEEIFSATRRCAGSKFQRVGRKTEKARAPNLVLIRGTLSLFVLFDRRCFTESAEKRWLDK